jgi:aminoglycoside phosphotransferase (APT) family kinase protein
MSKLEGSSIPGLEIDLLRDWFAEHVGTGARSLDARLLTGGRSNLTYEITDGSRSWVVRRPPLGHVLETAHDMVREFRMMSAVYGTAVPVPRPIAMCSDPAVIGAPFYVMELVDGYAYRRASELSRLGPERVAAISTRLIETLTTLHAVDPQSVGLDQVGRPDAFLRRQVQVWHRQMQASLTRELPTAAELHRRLDDRIPGGSRPSIVHGDFRLDNVLIDAADRPAAVIDWEMATVGDPMTDLGLLLVYGRLAAMIDSEEISDVSQAVGYPSEPEILDLYSRGSGLDMSAIGFYLGLASFKLAAILEGIHFRHLHGQTVGPGFSTLGGAVKPLLEAGLDSLKEYS